MHLQYSERGCKQKFIDALNIASLLVVVGKGEVLVANEVIHPVMEVTTNIIACL